MPEFRLYHFNGGHIRRATVIAADDQQAAIQIAAAKIDGELAELWHGAGIVHVFNEPAELHSLSPDLRDAID